MSKRVIFFTLSTLYFILLIFYFLLPFVGPYGHSHLQYSVAARSYLESGWQKFIPFVWPKQVYLNHPPLLYIFLAVFYQIFCFHDFIGRLMPFLFSLGSAYFFYLIIKKYFSKKIAAYSLFFYLTFPMFLFYGAFIQFEPLVLFFSFGAFYFLNRFLGNGKLFFLSLATCYLLLATLSDWSGLIFAVLLIIYLIFKKRRFLAFFFFILTTLYLILYTRYLSSLGFSVSNLLSAYFSRATLKEIFNIGFLLKFPLIILFRFLIYFSPLSIFPLLYLSSTFPLLSSGSKKIMTLLSLFPVLNCVLLLGGTYTHPYFLFFFIPIMAFFCGYLIAHLGGGRLNPERSRGRSHDSPEVNVSSSVLLAIHIFWSIIVFSLKVYQIKKFSWQYQVAIKTAEIIGQDKVFYKNWALDRELFYWYGKKMPIEIYPPELLALKKYQVNYYLFVCFPQCHKSDHRFLEELSRKFGWRKLDVKIPSYVFNLKEKPKEIIKLKEEISYRESFKFLGWVKKFFGIEQI